MMLRIAFLLMVLVGRSSQGYTWRCIRSCWKRRRYGSRVAAGVFFSVGVYSMIVLSFHLVRRRSSVATEKRTRSPARVSLEPYVEVVSYSRIQRLRPFCIYPRRLLVVCVRSVRLSGWFRLFLHGSTRLCFK